MSFKKWFSTLFLSFCVSAVYLHKALYNGASVEARVFTKRRYHQRKGKGMNERDKAMSMLLKGVEIRSCLQPESLGNKDAG